METKKFFEHYRVTAEPIGRVGAAVCYKAIDQRTGEAVTLQVIPLAAVDQAQRLQLEERVRVVRQLDHINVARLRAAEADDEYFGLVSEFVEAETVESWIVHHGPIAPDAVLRIGLQVVRALGAAAFLGLSHRAIEPSNILIVRSELSDGGWPLIKLLNFGLAGLPLYAEPTREMDIGAEPQPAFASPEQLLDKPIDFRSEIYSLGATMCYLLTGAVPLAVGGMKARLRARRLPELRRAPSALRNLLVHMLRENPDNRPQDPVAFEAELLECLRKVERRQAFGRRLGIPLATVVPRSVKPARTRSTMVRSTSPLVPTPDVVEPDLSPAPSTARQIIRGVVVFAALVLVGGVIAAFLLPEDVLPFRNQTTEEIGVPIGVPSPAQAATVAQTPALIVENNAATPTPQPSVSATPEIVAENSPSPSPTDTPPEPESSAAVAQSSVEDRETNSPNESTSREDEDERVAAPTPVQKKVARSTSPRRSVAASEETPRKVHTAHARVVGTTGDGRTILRLPSGRTVAIRPGYPDEDVDLGAPRRRRAYVPRDPDTPYQPFDPNRD